MANIDNLVQLDKYSEDEAKLLLEQATKENRIKIIGISKKTGKLIILRRDHLQEIINLFPNNAMLSLHDGTFEHNALLEFPHFEYIHYSRLWIDKVAADKLLSNPPPKNKNQFHAKLKIDENRPSNHTRAKAQSIVLELEEIIIDGLIETINLDTLWHRMLDNARRNLSNRFIKGPGDSIKDKETSKVWMREDAYPHTKKVLKWFESF